MNLTARRFILIAAAGILFATAALPNATAATRAKRYETSVVYPWTNVADPIGVTEDGTIDIGTVIFQPPFSSSTLSFTGKDDLNIAGNGLINLGICQDLHNDPLSCRSDEPQARGCVTGSQPLVLRNASTTAPVIVFVHAFSGCPYGFLIPPEVIARPAWATQGWITLTEDA